MLWVPRILCSDILNDISEQYKMQFSVVMRCESRILFCFKKKIVVGTIYTV